jgi:hypothetical protein
MHGYVVLLPVLRRDMTDEAWRAVKRDFVAALEAEVA